LAIAKRKIVAYHERASHGLRFAPAWWRPPQTRWQAYNCFQEHTPGAKGRANSGATEWPVEEENPNGVELS
jgi:hypothetical protein